MNGKLTLKERLAVLETKIETLTTHFTNHLSHHKLDRILGALYFALVIVMFCFIRWGV